MSCTASLSRLNHSWWKAALLLVLFLGVGSWTDAHAQTIFTRPYQPSTLSVEAVAPTFSGDSLDVASGALFVSASYTLNTNIELMVELPVARAGGNPSSSTGIGNPLIGFGFSSTSVPLLVEVGARLPLADDDLASRVGAFTDLGRGRAFQPEERLGYLLGNTRIPIGRQTSLRIRSGFSYAAFPRDSAEGERTETDVRIRYSAQLWREGDRFITGLTFTGRGTLTAPGSYSKKSIHHVALSTLVDLRRFAPGITVGLPLDASTRDVADTTIGLSLDIRID